MLRLLAYLLKNGVVTSQSIPASFDEQALTGLPSVNSPECKSACAECIKVCPTGAISSSNAGIAIDRGACIACTQCISICPEKIIVNDLSTSTYAYRREDLLVTANSQKIPSIDQKSVFQSSFAIRVVSTGCSACDLELSAANNPIFDMERFGVHVVASPRFADALVVTGPVPKAMHKPLLACFDAMSDPRIVIACGTCAISGGVHRDGYTEANGVQNILPVDLFIPGCPPHPWQIINGINAARKLAGRNRSAAGSEK